MIPGNDPAKLPLRDIHFPEAVSWWPLAPGWWIVMALLILFMVFLYWWLFIKKVPTRSIADIASEEFKLIQTNFGKHQNKAQLAKDLSEFLRRVCISLFPRTDTAGLTGHSWLAFLDQALDRPEFTQGCGKVINEAPYQSSPEYDEQQLLSLIENWLNSVDQQGQVE